MMWIAVACVAVLALATLFGGSWLSLIVVLVVGGFILSMLWHASARTAAVFDSEKGTLAITHTRGGKIVGEEDVPLAGVFSGNRRTGGWRNQRNSRPASLAEAVSVGR